MRIQKRNIIISFLLIFSLLISPFGGLTLRANADEKTITGIEISLKEGKTGIFYVKGDYQASDKYDVLDDSDIEIRLVYDNSTESDPVPLVTDDYTITTNINNISTTVGKDLAITASYTPTSATTTHIDSNELTVTILPAITINPKQIELKLADEQKTEFFDASNDKLDSTDTLGSEDLKLHII